MAGTTLFGAPQQEAEIAREAAALASLEPWRYIPGAFPWLLTDAERARVLVLLPPMGGMHCVASFDDERAYVELLADGEISARWMFSFVPASGVARELRAAFNARALATAHGLFPAVTVPTEGGARDLTAAECDELIEDLRVLTHYLNGSGVLEALTGAAPPPLELRGTRVEPLTELVVMDALPEDELPPSEAPARRRAKHLSDGPGIRRSRKR